MPGCWRSTTGPLRAEKAGSEVRYVQKIERTKTNITFSIEGWIRGQPGLVFNRVLR